MVTIRVHEAENSLWVRAFTQRSYGDNERPAYVLFKNKQAVGGYCTCRVGKCGLCSHVIALLYNLKYYTVTGYFKLAVACTSKPQKWHKKGSRNRDMPITPASRYKVDNTINEQDRKKQKRQIANTVQSIADQLNSTDVELHFLRTLGASESQRMRTGGLYTLLSHRYNTV